MAKTKKIVDDLSAVVKFEQWVRFYFIKKDGDDLIIAPEAEHMTKIKALYPDYYELVEAMCLVKMNPQTSQRLILDFIKDHLDGKKYKSTEIHKALDSKDFTTEMYLFNMWLELHDNQLTEQIIGYDEWLALYKTWRTSEQGQKVLLSMESGGLSGSSHENVTVH